MRGPLSQDAGEKAAIRREINEFCLNHVFKDDIGKAGIGEIPVCIVIYLGHESARSLAPLMTDGFESLLNVRPVTGVMTIDEEQVKDPRFLLNELVAMVREFYGKGSFVNDQMIRIPVSFMAVMNDPFLASDAALRALDSFHESFEQLRESLMVNLGAVSFYGFFDQGLTAREFDYSGAFRYVADGNREDRTVWSNVYHLQKTLLMENYEEPCRAAAMSVLMRSLFSEGQGTTSVRPGDYSWYYLGLDEMNLPEQLMCGILINSYSRHITPEPLHAEEARAFRYYLQEGMNRYIDRHCEVFRTPECVTYLPARFIAGSEEPSGRRHSLFRRRNDYETDSLPPSSILLDESSIGTILKESSAGTVDQLKEHQILLAIFRNAICSIGRVQNMETEMAAALMHEAEELISEVKFQMARTALYSDSSDEKVYFETLFGQYVARERCRIVIEVLESLKTDAEFQRALQEEIAGIKRQDLTMVRILGELRVNAYGGAPALQMRLPAGAMNIPTPLGAPVSEACRAIPQDILNMLVNDEYLFRAYAGEFVTQAESRSTVRRSIGRVNGNAMMHDQTTVLMTARDLDFPHMIVKNSRYLRANTLQVMTTCLWDSLHNLTQYDPENR